MLGEGFLFSCERLGRSLWETIVSSKAVPEVLKIKYKSKFKLGFTNPEAVAWMCSVIKIFLNILQNSQENTCIRVTFLIKLQAADLRSANLLRKRLWQRCFLVNSAKFLRTLFFYRTPPVAPSPNRGHLHCAILKALDHFQEKRTLKSRDMQPFLQNVPNEIFKIFKMFENNMKFTRAACWINSKISNRQKHHTHKILALSLLLVIIMVQLLEVFKVGLSPSKSITLFASIKALYKWWNVLKF